MAEIQEGANQKIWELTTKGTRFTSSMLLKLIKAFLNKNQRHQSIKSQEHGKDGVVKKIDEKLTAAITGQGTNKMEFKDFVQKIDSNHGTVSTFNISEHDDIFDKVMIKYGIPYATREFPLLDDDGKQIYDYSKCKYEKDEHGADVMDYSECLIKKDEHGKPLFEKEERSDAEGNKYFVEVPVLESGSPEPKKKLEKGSPQPELVKQYSICFDQRFTEAMTMAFKEYAQKNELKKAKDKDKASRPKKNIKEQIKKYKEKMKEINKDTPEKHHNRGEKSL